VVSFALSLSISSCVTSISSGRVFVVVAVVVVVEDDDEGDDKDDDEDDEDDEDDGVAKNLVGDHRSKQLLHDDDPIMIFGVS